MIYIGIDPGKSGSVAFNHKGSVWTVSFKESLADVSDAIRDAVISNSCLAMIEQVHSSPQMGVKSAFSFGQSFGQIEGILTAFKIPFDRVRPQVWQKALGCLTKGDKNITKRKAQELFPDIKITHANADALLISEYNRRVNG